MISIHIEIFKLMYTEYNEKKHNMIKIPKKLKFQNQIIGDQKISQRNDLNDEKHLKIFFALFLY